MTNWKDFGKLVLERFCAGDATIEMIDVQNWGVKTGVLVAVEGGYDPETHFDATGCLEPGDEMYAVSSADDEWNYDMDEAPKTLSSTNEFLLLLHDPSKPHTIYKRHAKIFGCPEFNGKGVFQAVWGGAWEHNDKKLPDWWFVDDERFETALNPIAWKRITTPEVKA